jgi:hypothetical protein
MDGIPRRETGQVLPAAPGTPLTVSPTTGASLSGGMLLVGVVVPVPITKLTFSSFVIAAITSSTGACPS